MNQRGTRTAGVSPPSAAGSGLSSSTSTSGVGVPLLSPTTGSAGANAKYNADEKRLAAQAPRPLPSAASMNAWPSPTHGNGNNNGSYTVTVNGNDTDLKRNGTLTVPSSTITRRISNDTGGNGNGNGSNGLRINTSSTGGSASVPASPLGALSPNGNGMTSPIRAQTITGNSNGEEGKEVWYRRLFWCCCGRVITLRDLQLTPVHITDARTIEYERARVVMETTGGGFTSEEMDALVTRFYHADDTRCGFITTQQLLAMPEFAFNPLVTRLEYCIAKPQSHEGYRFLEFVNVMKVFSAKCPKQEKAKFMFRLYDADNDGLISRTDLSSILSLVFGDRWPRAERQRVVDKAWKELRPRASHSHTHTRADALDLSSFIENMNTVDIETRLRMKL